MPVYDIEVEATHNFIAQGIVAHNTYQSNQKPVTSNQKIGEGMAGSPLREKEAAFSSVKEGGNDLGGVDFIRLPIVTQQEITPRSIMAGSPQINLSRLDLGEEWLQIQNMLNAGITPSTERIREYVASSCIREDEDFNREIDKILSCIADILRLQEERVAVTEPALREILVLLESDKPAMELQLALSKITVLPKEYTRKN